MTFQAGVLYKNLKYILFINIFCKTKIYFSNRTTYRLIGYKKNLSLLHQQCIQVLFV